MVTLSVVGSPNPKRRVQEELIRGVEHPLPETVAVIEEILRVTNIVKGGFNGRPVGPRDMAFLMHRSLSMGVPAPMHAGAGGGRWEPDDISGFFTRREWIYNPLTSSTVKVLAEHNGKVVERYVAVLSLGPLPGHHLAGERPGPWMLTSDKLGFPVEWSMAGTMLDPKELTRRSSSNRIGRRHLVALRRAQPDPATGGGTGDRGRDPQPGRGDRGRHPDRGPVPRPIRLATYAASEAERLEQARALVDSYGERLNRAGPPRGQAQLLREFVPGEPWSTVGYQPAAGEVPRVGDAARGRRGGHADGALLAYGIGSARRAVRFDPHYGPETLQPGAVHHHRRAGWR